MDFDDIKDIFKYGFVLVGILFLFYLFQLPANQWLPFYTVLPLEFQTTPFLLYLQPLILIGFFILIIGCLFYVVKD